MMRFVPVLLAGLAVAVPSFAQEAADHSGHGGMAQTDHATHGDSAMSDDGPSTTAYRAAMAQMMVGSEVAAPVVRRADPGAALVTLQGVSTPDVGSAPGLKNVDLELRRHVRRLCLVG